MVFLFFIFGFSIFKFSYFVFIFRFLFLIFRFNFWFYYFQFCQIFPILTWVLLLFPILLLWGIDNIELQNEIIS